MAFGIVFFAGFFSALFFELVDGLGVSAVVAGGVVAGGVVALGAAVAAGGVVVAGGVCADTSDVCEMSTSAEAAASKYDFCIRTSKMTDPQYWKHPPLGSLMQVC
jgi:hypothetical protein